MSHVSKLFRVYLLHGPPMSVDQMTEFGLALYNHANFNRFVEISVFLCFSLVNQVTPPITVQCDQ